jgi:hypothetical protein
MMEMLHFLEHLSYPLPVFTLRHWIFMLITVLLNLRIKPCTKLLSLVFDFITANSSESETYFSYTILLSDLQKLYGFQITLATVDLKCCVC